MTRDLKKSGIDLYHDLSNELPPCTGKAGIPTVVTIHDLIFERFTKLYHTTEVWAYKRKFRQACKQADAIIATSRQTKQDIADFYHISPDKIHIGYQSCDLAYTQRLSEKRLDAISSIGMNMRLMQSF